MPKQKEQLINGTSFTLELDMGALSRERHISINRRHCNDGYEVTILLAGSAQIDVEGDLRTMQAGQAVVIAPGRYHILQALPGDFERFNFRFHLSKSPLADAARLQIPSHTFFDAKPEMVRLIRELFRLYAERAPYWENLQYTLLKALLLYILRQIGLVDGDQTQQKLRFSPTRMHQIDRYIEANLDGSPCIEELAQIMNLSRRQTMRVLQETCGMGFREKLIKARMDRAAWLLRTSDKPLENIVSMVGYSSHSAFHQAFRTYFHTTPLQYRKQFLQTKNDR